MSVVLRTAVFEGGNILRILMFRAWQTLPYSATFLTLRHTGVGGTEFQLLLHARALKDMGHDVIVAGVSSTDVVQEGITFLGSDYPRELKSKIQRYSDTDVIFTNQSQGLRDLKSIMPSASIVQVCQNGPNFEADSNIDVYGFVGQGQFAYYSVKYPAHRNKFMLLVNVPPVCTIYSKLEPVDPREQVIWVGGFEKEGFRRWARAMARVMTRHPRLKWVLCAPSYSEVPKRFPSAISDLDLSIDQLQFKNLPLFELAVEINRSQMLLASLGGEDGPTGYLDGHALGVPVLCGDDIIGKFSNPEGTGLRCTTVGECETAVEFLLARPDVRMSMGELGRHWIKQAGLTEEHQRAQLHHILMYIQLTRTHKLPAKLSRQSDLKFSLRYTIERAEIKFAKHRRGKPGYDTAIA